MMVHLLAGKAGLINQPLPVFTDHYTFLPINPVSWRRVVKAIVFYNQWTR
jgi:hypothetical protein